VGQPDLAQPLHRVRDHPGVRAVAHPRRAEPLHPQAADHPRRRRHRAVVADPLADPVLRALRRLPVGAAGVSRAAHAGDPDLFPRPRPRLPVRPARDLRLRLPVRGHSRDRGFCVPRPHPARQVGLAAAPREVVVLRLVRGRAGRDPVSPERLDRLLRRRLRPGGGADLLRQLLSRAAHRQPLLLPLSLPLRRDLRPAQSRGFLRHRAGRRPLRRLPALRPGLRHGHPGVGAGQGDRPRDGARGLHGLRALPGVLPDRRPRAARRAQRPLARRAARCDPAARHRAGGGRAAGRPTRCPRPAAGSARSTGCARVAVRAGGWRAP